MVSSSCSSGACVAIRQQPAKLQLGVNGQPAANSSWRLGWGEALAPRGDEQFVTDSIRARFLLRSALTPVLTICHYFYIQCFGPLVLGLLNGQSTEKTQRGTLEAGPQMKWWPIYYHSLKDAPFSGCLAGALSLNS